MSLFPKNLNVARTAQTDVPAIMTTLLHPVRRAVGSPVVADVDRLLGATDTSGSVVTTVTTFLAQPDVPRSISATPGGVTADVPAGDITVTGTDIADAVITDVITFLANATTVISTAKAFKTVTSIVFPIQDGAGATYVVGVSDKLGLPDKLTYNTVTAAYLATVRETTAPTVTMSATVLSLNTVDLNSAMNSGAVVVDYLV